MPAPLPIVVGQALQTLRHHPLRTGLSALGVIIGVGALVAVLALGDGMEAFGRRQLEGESILYVGVQPGAVMRVDGLRVPVPDPVVLGEAEADAIRREVPGVAGSSLQVQGAARVARSTADTGRYALLVGTTSDAVNLLGPAGLAAGRFFTAEESAAGAPVLVVSWELAEAVADGEAPGDVLGQEALIAGEPLTVIGIVAARSGDGDVVLRAWAPLAPARAGIIAPGQPSLPQLALRAASLEAVDSVQAGVTRWLERRYGSRAGTVEVVTSARRLRQVKQGMLVFKLFLGAITGISLVVGGIGIANVLLASVTERTREIGIRRAIGAERRDLLAQLLAEAVVITGAGALLGALLGIVVAVGAAFAIRQATDAPIEVAITGSSVLLVAGAALAVGVLAGTYPARRAARLSVIEAIRHE